MPSSPAPDKIKSSRGVGSIDVGMRVLSALVESGKPAKLKELAAMTGMAPAKIHRYLASFVKSGMVAQQGAAGRYELGPFAFRIGAAAVSKINVLKVAGERLGNLRDRVELTCCVCGWSDIGPLVLHWEDSRRPITVNVRSGNNLPLLRSASGRVFLAFGDQELIAAVLATEMAATGMSDSQVEDLRKATRERGLGFVSGDYHKDITSFAAPLFDPSGDLAGSVAVLGLSDEFDASTRGRTAQLLNSFAKDVAQPA